MVRTLLISLPVVLVVGCAFDADEDGLTNKEEKELGTDKEVADSDGDGLSDGDEVLNGADPLQADTDGDGLTDGDEIENGADPNEVDTDGDGYTDRDEVFEGKDPADDRSKIYKGGWPYYFEKTELAGGAVDGTMSVGKRFAQLELKDHLGDTVNLFDFYSDTTPVVIDISAQWCPPCNAVAAWLDGAPDPYYESLWPGGPDKVKNGEVVWITIIGQDYAGQPAVKETATEWHDAYPAKYIPVLADTDYDAVDYTMLGWWPTTVLLEADLKLSSSGADGYTESVLSELAARFP